MFNTVCQWPSRQFIDPLGVEGEFHSAVRDLLMSTENSTASGASTGTTDGIPDEIDSCPVCDS